MTKAAFSFPDFGKMMSDMKMPNVDFTSMMAIQQKNFEAVTAANAVVDPQFAILGLMECTILPDHG